MVGHTAWGLYKESPDPPTFPSWLEGIFFSRFGSTDDTVNSKSVVGLKPGESGVVKGYQVSKFTHLVGKHFVVLSHIYSGFMGNVSSLTPFSLEAGCEDYSFLDQAVVDFEQDLDSILNDSTETLELDTSFEEADGVHSSVTSGFQCSYITISDTSKLQLATSIKS